MKADCAKTDFGFDDCPSVFSNNLAIKVQIDRKRRVQAVGLMSHDKWSIVQEGNS